MSFCLQILIGIWIWLRPYSFSWDCIFESRCRCNQLSIYFTIFVLWLISRDGDYYRWSEQDFDRSEQSVSLLIFSPLGQISYQCWWPARKSKGRIYSCSKQLLVLSVYIHILNQSSYLSFDSQNHFTKLYASSCKICMDCDQPILANQRYKFFILIELGRNHNHLYWSSFPGEGISREWVSGYQWGNL